MDSKKEIKGLNISFVLMIVLIVAVAVTIDYASSTYEVATMVVSTLGSDGSVIKKTISSIPWFIPLSKLVVNFLYTLAVGVFVSAFIASRLEKAKIETERKEIEELKKSLNRDVFESVFKTLMPEEIFNIVKAEIIESKIVRRNANWLYDFKVIGEDEIELKIVSHYELHNTSKDRVVNPVKLVLTSDGDEYKVLEARCISSDNSTTKVDYHFEKADSHGIVQEDTSEGKVISYDLDVAPNDFVEFTTTVSRVYKGDIYDSQFNAHPLVNAQLTVNYPSNYILSIDPFFSNELRRITTTYNQEVYKITGGILPKQGFLFSLKKKKTNIILEKDAA